MKKIKKAFTLILLIFTTINLSAQDLVILKSGEEMNVKITEVGENYIKYKKLDFEDGPNFNLSASKIFMIKYSNGEKQVFNIEKNINQIQSEAKFSTIEEGTIIPLYSARTLSSKDLKVGSVVEFRVKDAVVDNNNNVLIRGNQIVYATVNESSSAKGLGKEGSLNFMIQEIKAIDNQKVPAYLNIGSDGKNRAGTSIAVGALLFWPALFLKGKEAELKAGTIVNASISESRNIKIDPELKSTSKSAYIPTPKIQIDCGKKPKNINPFTKKPYDNFSKEYTVYKKKLEEWNNCMSNK